MISPTRTWIQIIARRRSCLWDFRLLFGFLCFCWQKITNSMSSFSLHSHAVLRKDTLAISSSFDHKLNHTIPNQTDSLFHTNKPNIAQHITPQFQFTPFMLYNYLCVLIHTKQLLNVERKLFGPEITHTLRSLNLASLNGQPPLKLTKHPCRWMFEHELNSH